MPVFENREKDILDQLLGGPRALKNIFILGMAGVGKTTLAKQLYNHHSVCYHFDRRLWCTISQMPSWRNFLVNLLTCLSNEIDKDDILGMVEGALTHEIYKCLKFRRFLIVVDDIWHLDDWKYLQRFFPNEEEGSRILLTSRNGDIARSCGIIHQLFPWSNDQCLQLLKKKVLENYNPHPPLPKEIGKKIAAKCYGLPLVVVVIAGTLSTMAKNENSLKILSDCLDYYEHSDQSTSIMQVLELSYKNLPSRLKPCFLYFGVYQEGAKIRTKKLKQLWIAEGFIQKEENERAENVAEQYLKELIDKNLIIVTKKRSDGGAKVCAIHDLLHDLCLKIGEQENFLTWMRSDYSICNLKYHRLCVNNRNNGTSITAPFGLHYRSLLVSFLNQPLYLFNVKLLRVFHCLPVGLCDDLVGTELLFHLRYLVVHRLPALIHRNSNLEFLTVSQRVVLTPDILKMLKLRYICSPVVVFGISCETIQTNNLEFLSTIYIRNKKDEGLLRFFPNLRKLQCRYAWSREETGDPSLDFQFLAECESLAVTSFIVREIVEIKLPSSVKKLNLIGLHLPWEKMSMIRTLPNLEVLKLGYEAFVGETWNMGDEEYPRLRYMEMEDLSIAKWLIVSSGQFRRLQRLILKNCYHLMEIPSEIGGEALSVIKVLGRHRPSLANSAKKIQEEERDMGNDDLKIIIRDRYRKRSEPVRAY